jgi:hypothetical protein
MKRTLAALAVAAAMVAAMAWPASAKGEGPVGATITGPGIGGSGGPGVPGGPGSGGSDEGSGAGGTGGTAVGTIEIGNRGSFEAFQNNPLWRLATFSGAVLSCSACLSFIDTSPPKDLASLGPEYQVTYFEGKCCKHATHQLLYPYAPGGPWAYTMASRPEDFFLGQQQVGWWHADGRMGLLFERLLRHIGMPPHNPMPVAPVVKAPNAAKPIAEGEAAGSGGSAPWRLPVAIVAMIALLALGALAARPRSSTRPA